jgi:hypothetical protein
MAEEKYQNKLRNHRFQDIGNPKEKKISSI